MFDLVRSEPVMFQAVIQAGLALLLSFGVHLTADQIGAIMAFTAALLAFITRQMVIPHKDNPELLEVAVKANGKTSTASN